MTSFDAGLVQLLLGGAHILLALGVSAHIVLTKDDVRGAIGWAGLVWLTPFLGSVLYGFFGINRIRRQAGRLRRGRELATHFTAELAVAQRDEILLPVAFPVSLHHLATLVGTATGGRLTIGNRVTALVNGDEAYPAMLAAIDRAARSVALETYLFDRGYAGDQFIEALGRAVKRGVAVRVLIDGVGARYSRPPAIRSLKGHGVRVALFLPPRLPVPNPYFNLRNHRKLMIVDGSVGFCGGMNIRDGCVLGRSPADATQDLHFRITGPVVKDLMGVFAFDWAFTTREQLTGGEWFPPLEPAGGIVARVVPDGPDEDFEMLLLTLMGAVSQAERTFRLATPYFLPDAPLIDALRIASLRGVQVDVVLPRRGNLRLVQWAATAQLAQIVKWGCRVYLSPPPFDHSKLLVVDGMWSLVGSSNWDPRSLRLNFECAVECYSKELAAQLDALLDAKIAAGRRLTLADLESRSLPVKLRDGVARLAQPYL